MTVTGAVAWFDLTKQFGFVALEGGHGDAFLHMTVLKEAGYVWLPRGTTVRVPARTSPSGASPRPERVKLRLTADQAQWARRWLSQS